MIYTSPSVRLVNHYFTTRKPLFHDPYESFESWTGKYTLSLSNDIHLTNSTTRKPLFHDQYDSYESNGSCSNGLQVVQFVKCISLESLRVYIQVHDSYDLYDLYGSWNNGLRVLRLVRVLLKGILHYTGRISSCILDNNQNQYWAVRSDSISLMTQAKKENPEKGASSLTMTLIGRELWNFFFGRSHQNWLINSNWHDVT